MALGIIGANTRKTDDNTAASPPPSAPATSSTPSPPPSTTAPVASATVSTPGRTSAAPTTAAPSLTDALRATFRTDHSSQPWFTKISSVDLDGQAVIGRSTLAKGDQAAVAACEALRSSATRTPVNFQSVAVRDTQDRTLAHWSGLTGDAACTA
ncbi:hypothetical protein [Amycolatopsis vastitatis]|uniref:hypothetical protein n=1 Tax=Amycolatopsis vastitatis TaxID=1905142 RepID=UPI001304046E|nr:hypothetical protein [Amycolatopsis vastitatis]